MSQVNKARMVELGKTAALEYEKFQEKQGAVFDYGHSVDRLYVR